MERRIYDWPVLISQLFLDVAFCYVLLVGRETGQIPDEDPDEAASSFCQNQVRSLAGS